MSKRSPNIAEAVVVPSEGEMFDHGEDNEMVAILREFAERHLEFLRTQECEPALPAHANDQGDQHGN